METSDADCWARFVKCMLESNGFSDVWLCQGVGDRELFVKIFTERLNYVFFQNWSERLSMSSRAIFYKSIKQNWSFGQYLEHVNVTQHRKALCRLIVSSHRLRIETGRWERPPEFKISDNVTITSEPCVEALGVNIDNRLTFIEHVSSCCTKAARQLNAFSRISKNLDLKCRKLIFQSFALSNFTCCPLVWHFCGKQNNGKIEKNPRTGTEDTIWWLRVRIQRTPW